MGECVSVCFKRVQEAAGDEFNALDELDYSAPKTVEQYRRVQTEMESYTKTIQKTQTTDIKREFSRLKAFVCDSTYPELQPDRESDWHCKDHCEVRGCKVQKWTTFTRRHHCRMCARSICGDHSKKRRDIRAWTLEKVRVCDQCAARLDKGCQIYEEMELPLHSDALTKIFVTRPATEWKELIESIGLEYTRKIETDILALTAQHQHVAKFEAHVEGLQTALEEAPEVEAQVATKGSPDQLYGTRNNRTEAGKSLDRQTEKLTRTLEKAVQREQTVSQIAKNSDELARVSKEYGDLAKRLKEKYAKENSMFGF